MGVGPVSGLRPRRSVRSRWPGMPGLAPTGSEVGLSDQLEIMARGVEKIYASAAMFVIDLSRLGPLGVCPLIQAVISDLSIGAVEVGVVEEVRVVLLRKLHRRSRELQQDAVCDLDVDEWAP